MKSQALKTAWILFRKYQITFSQALKDGWKQVKKDFYNKRLSLLEDKRELLIQMNNSSNYTSMILVDGKLTNNPKTDKYLNLMLSIKKEIAFYMRKKHSLLDTSNYKFSIPLNIR